MNKKQTYNTDAAWEKLHSRLKEDNLLKPEKPKVYLNTFVRAAAILIIGILISAIAFYTIPKQMKTHNRVVENNSNEIKMLVLPDNSQVFLNSGAQIQYPQEFSEDSRTVEFKGEAFFDISKNKEKPFVIKTGKSEIQVLGTSFNVNTLSKSAELEVIVKTGKVKVSKTDKNVVLVPGEVAEVKNNSILKTKNTNKNYLSWKTKEFNFEGVELSQILTDLNKAYKVAIVIEKEEILKRKLNTGFKNQELETILKVIAETYNLSIKKEDGKIILY